MILNSHTVNRIYLMASSLGCKFKVSPKGSTIVFMDEGEIYQVTISFKTFLEMDYFVLRNIIANNIQLMKEGR